MTEQDRELLELAAKAAGHSLVWGEKHKLGDDTIDCTDIAYIRSGQSDDGDVYWNPLTDDGDALRLAATLGIDIEWRADGRVAAYRHANANGYCFAALESSREDRAANVRRAIVRAAAEIGRNTP